MPSLAAAVSVLSASRHASSLRVARTFSRRAICASRTAVLSISRISTGGTILVDADDDFLAAIDACLANGCCFLDSQLRHAGLNGLGHAAHLFNFVDELASLSGEIGGELFNVVGTGKRVDHVGDAGLFLQDKLCIAGAMACIVTRMMLL